MRKKTHRTKDCVPFQIDCEYGKGGRAKKVRDSDVGESQKSKKERVVRRKRGRERERVRHVVREKGRKRESVGQSTCRGERKVRNKLIKYIYIY